MVKNDLGIPFDIDVICSFLQILRADGFPKSGQYFVAQLRQSTCIHLAARLLVEFIVPIEDAFQRLIGILVLSECSRSGLPTLSRAAQGEASRLGGRAVLLSVAQARGGAR